MTTGLEFEFATQLAVARGSGAVWFPDLRLLCVSDMHLGKSDRIARRTGAFVPPYEVTDTLRRLRAEVDALNPHTVVCLGDSFDDLVAVENFPDAAKMELAGMQAGRDWIWIEGNHDPGPVELGGTHMFEYRVGGLILRHIAQPDADTMGEVSGHYHPKATFQLRGRRFSRACFLFDDARLILPAFGTYTGGLRTDSDVLCALMDVSAHVILTGQSVVRMPMPRG